MKNAKSIPASFVRGASLSLLCAATFALSACASQPNGRLTQLDWPGYDTTVGKSKSKWRDRTPERVADRDSSRKSEPTPVPTARPRPVKQVARNEPAQTAVPPLTAAKFIWPVNGQVISGFGVTATGGRNDGINISVPAGEPVRAAATGTVTYAGELRGYGKIVLLQHDDGYVTTYAHNQSVNVNKGDRVLKGQVIAYSGQTGDVSRPQLHFEVRRGVKPVDPRPMLVAYNPS
ncbi:MAG: peptidoglycan DD-metalloendopeptidase family protein [Alphaproteobacteria bacterium]|nr:peptidoglycan DD-metalloendopeptidase family protein [Alphaproteobacteria bacterium]